jgi:hypothetical protein
MAYIDQKALLASALVVSKNGEEGNVFNWRGWTIVSKSGRGPVYGSSIHARKTYAILFQEKCFFVWNEAF